MINVLIQAHKTNLRWRADTDLFFFVNMIAVSTMSHTSATAARFNPVERNGISGKLFDKPNRPYTTVQTVMPSPGKSADIAIQQRSGIP